MGQYYKPVNVDKMEYLYSHDFDNGLKLMEHSYIGNSFVEAVERLLSPGGSWHRCHLVWAGDYMDTGLFLPEGTPEVDEEGYDINLYGYIDENGKNAMGASKHLAKIKDYAARMEATKQSASEWLKTLPKKGTILVNWTKKLCIDLTKEEPQEEYSGRKWTIHPLPLLTCSGNGKGGGDYRGQDECVTGSWAGDEISIEYDMPENFQKIGPMNIKEA